ncbi:hypothetical protein LOCC1_G006334 [Lachnellula occidentalis]|uniref:Zn(2)-C6 fungal-type domain-containing protein n=1 Tax=Lachnellula occidentalis TaxID=215460 RepID=A0A8H8UAB5_9HELO|nr:hypothetical protein LOCC1_G006334 [Lachnellula occidentalis]
MVYCGKPSKGCQACRDRKTRCTRARRPCPGYRDQLDLIFRDESEAVIGKAKGKAKAKANSKAKQRSSNSPSSSTTTSSDNWTPPADDEQQYLKNELTEPLNLNTHGGSDQEMVPFCSFSFPPKTPLEFRAQAFFYSKSPLWLRNFELLGTLCSQTYADDHLLASMSAVGLASLSNTLHTPELLLESRKDYVNALRLTNAALRSPTEVTKDSTLFSVMILSIYETVTGTNEHSIDAWTAHVNGAAALVKLRGLEQFKTDAGQRMFLQVLAYIMLSCIQRTIPMPAHMIELRNTAAKYMDTRKTAWRSAGVIIDFTTFRAGIRESKIVGPRNLVNGALEIDRRFADVFSVVPKEYKYETVYTDENPHLVWNGMYHIYSEYWSAQVWNGTRTCRILLGETIRDQLIADSKSLEPSFSPEEKEVIMRDSIVVSMQCQRDVLASVPQHTSAQDSGSSGNFILWPLYLVGVMDLATDAVRAWVSRRLCDIGHMSGINQATLLGQFIANRNNPFQWEANEVFKEGFFKLAGIQARFEDMDEEGLMVTG